MFCDFVTLLFMNFVLYRAIFSGYFLFGKNHIMEFSISSSCQIIFDNWNFF